MGIPVIQSRSQQPEGTNVSTTTITAPAGIVDGDVLVIVIATDGNSVFTFPTGFMVKDQGFGPSNRCTLGVASKIASSESGDYVVTWTGGTEQSIAFMYRIDGADSGNEIQDPNESNTGTSATASIVPVAATDQVNALVLVCFGMDDDDITTDGGGDPDYNVENVGRSSSGANTCSAGVQSRGQVGASVPPQCDLTLTASEEWRSIWFAVRGTVTPAVAGPKPIIVGRAVQRSSIF